MADPLSVALLTLSAGTNLAGKMFSQPQRSRYNRRQIAQLMEINALRSMETQLGSARQSAGMLAEGLGLGGGEEASLITSVEAPIRAETTRQLGDAETDLLLNEMQMEDEYQSRRADWMSSLFNDLSAVPATMATQRIRSQELKDFAAAMGNDASPTDLETPSPFGLKKSGALLNYLPGKKTIFQTGSDPLAVTPTPGPYLVPGGDASVVPSTIKPRMVFKRPLRPNRTSFNRSSMANKKNDFNRPFWQIKNGMDKPFI